MLSRAKGTQELSLKTWARNSDRSGSRLSGKENGELLAEGETEFDVLVTVNTNLLYQQNLAGADSPLWFSNHPPIALNTSAI